MLFDPEWSALFLAPPPSFHPRLRPHHRPHLYVAVAEQQLYPVSYLLMVLARPIPEQNIWFSLSNGAIYYQVDLVFVFVFIFVFAGRVLRGDPFPLLGADCIRLNSCCLIFLLMTPSTLPCSDAPSVVVQGIHHAWNPSRECAEAATGDNWFRSNEPTASSRRVPEKLVFLRGMTAPLAS